MASSQFGGGKTTDGFRLKEGAGRSRKILQSGLILADATLQFDRQRMARHLWQINFGDGSWLPFQARRRLME
jgi:hypothetical protein